MSPHSICGLLLHPMMRTSAAMRLRIGGNLSCSSRQVVSRLSLKREKSRKGNRQMTATIRPPAPEKKAERAAATEPKSPSVVAGFNGNRRVPPPVNEPVKSYAPGSPERAALKARLKEMSSEKIDIPIIIGGKEIRNGETAQSVMPHNHKHVLADWHKAT